MTEYTSMAPVWFTDVLGSAAMIVISFVSVRYAVLLRRTEPANEIWTYLLVLALALALAAFALSRGVGQLCMRVLVLLGERQVGAMLRPYVGGINTLVFVVVASITVLFFLVHRINTRILKALDLAERHEGPVHLLLTDVVLPRMDGASLFQLISQQRPDTRALYVSGYTEDYILHHGVLKPGLNFLQKPFAGDALAAKVRAVLDSPRN